MSGAVQPQQFPATGESAVELLFMHCVSVVSQVAQYSECHTFFFMSLVRCLTNISVTDNQNFPDVANRNQSPQKSNEYLTQVC